MTVRRTLDPERLAFDRQANYVRAGHWYTTATYPSWSKKGMLHRVTVRDDGAAIDCTCTGFNVVGRCFHLDQAAEIIRAANRLDYRAMDAGTLRAADRWFARNRDRLSAAEVLMRDACGDVVAERALDAGEEVA